VYFICHRVVVGVSDKIIFQFKSDAFESVHLSDDGVLTIHTDAEGLKKLYKSVCLKFDAYKVEVPQFEWFK